MADVLAVGALQTAGEHLLLTQSTGGHEAYDLGKAMLDGMTHANVAHARGARHH